MSPDPEGGRHNNSGEYKQNSNGQNARADSGVKHLRLNWNKRERQQGIIRERGSRGQIHSKESEENQE